MDIEFYLQAAPVASVIFAITLAASLYTFNNPAKHRELMLHPYSILRGHRYHALITSGFVHADLPHLILNMVTFFFFAFPLELFMVEETGGGIAGHFLF